MDLNGKSDPYIVIKTPSKVMVKRNIFEYEMIEVKNKSVELPVDSVIDCSTTLLDSQATSAAHHYARKTHPPTDGYSEVFVSDIVESKLDPRWQPFRIGFYELCKGNPDVELLIECYDWDHFRSSDFIGSFKVSVRALLASKKDVEFQLLNKQNEPTGMLCFQCQPSVTDIVYCDFKAHALNLDKKDLLGLSDPYFVIKTPLQITEHKISNHAGLIPLPASKSKYGLQNHSATEGYREIFESSVVKKTLNPVWGMFRIGFYAMCRGNPGVKLLIECYDHNGLLPNTFIGSAEVSVQSLLDTRDVMLIPLLSKKHRSAGTFCIQCKPSNTATYLRSHPSINAMQ